MKITAELLVRRIAAGLLLAAAFALPALAAPAGFGGTAVSSAAVSWSWIEEAGVDGYRVRDAGGNILSPDLGPATTWWLETSLGANTTYYRSVESFTGAVPSACAPSPAVTLAAQPVWHDFTRHVSSITAEWVAGGNPEGTIYVLENTTRSLQYTTTLSSCTETGLSPDTSYTYRLKAINRANVSTAWESDAAIRTHANIPPAPEIAGVFADSVAVTVVPGAGNPSWTEYAVMISSAGWAVYADIDGALSAVPVYADSSTWPSPLSISAVGANKSFTFNECARNFSGIATPFGPGVVVRTLASAPVSPALGSVAVSSVTLSWDAGANPAGVRYEVSRSADNFVLEISTPAALADDLQAAATVLYNLVPNTTHYFRIRAFNDDGVPSVFAPSVSTVTLAAVPVPGTPQAGVTSVRPAWAAAGNPGDTTYIAENVTLNVSSSTVLLSWLNDSLEPNTTYQYRVKAVSRNGRETSWAVFAATPTLAAQPPAPVLTAVNVSSVSLSIAAGANPGWTEYAVRVSSAGPWNACLQPGGGFSGAPVYASTAAWNSPVIAAALTPNTTFTIAVTARNSARITTAESPAISAVTLPALPAGPSFTSVYASSMTLSWSASGNPGDTRYEILESTDNFTLNLTTSVAAADNLTALSSAIGGLAPDTTYWFKLRAVGHSGEVAAYTGVISSVTLAAQPPAFEGFDISTRAIAVGWANAGENPPDTRYVVQASGDPLFSGIVASSATVNAAGQARMGPLTPNATYYLRLVALNRTGRATLQGAATPPLMTYAAAPSSLSALPLPSDRAALSWSADTNPSYTRYEVSLSTDNFAVHFATPVPLAAGLRASATTVYHLAPETVYYFRVRAFNEAHIATVYSNVIASATAPAPPASVSRDVNGDGIDETALNGDGDPGNGYDAYQGINSTATLRVDGDTDGCYDFFISTAGGSEPEAYWDPDQNFAGPVGRTDVTGDGIDDYVYDSDGDGQPDAGYNPAGNQRMACAVFNGSPLGLPGVFLRFADGAAGYQFYMDNSGASRAVVTLSAGANANAEFFIDTAGDGLPDRYADAERGIGSTVTLRDFDGDGIADWGVDYYGTGFCTAYYRRPLGPLVPVQAVARETAYVPVPNPFHPHRGNAVIVYDLAAAGDVTIDIYDIAGEKVAVLVNGYRAAGRHQVRWDGSNGEYDAADGDMAGGGSALARGVYIIRYKLPSQQIMKKIAVLR